MNAQNGSFVLTIVCPDTVGIVAAVAGCLTAQDCFIEESNHFGDPDTCCFFMRTRFSPRNASFSRSRFEHEFAPIAKTFSMQWELHDRNVLPRVLILTSKHDHCVNDLLYRYRTDTLRMTVPMVHEEVPVSTTAGDES